MMVFPEQYIGKAVKMDGLFAYYHDEATGNYYFACIIQGLHHLGCYCLLCAGDRIRSDR